MAQQLAQGREQPRPAVAGWGPWLTVEASAISQARSLAASSQYSQRSTPAPCAHPAPPTLSRRATLTATQTPRAWVAEAHSERAEDEMPFEQLRRVREGLRRLNLPQPLGLRRLAQPRHGQRRRGQRGWRVGGRVEAADGSSVVTEASMDPATEHLGLLAPLVWGQAG